MAVDARDRETERPRDRETGRIHTLPLNADGADGEVGKGRTVEMKGMRVVYSSNCLS